MSNFPDMVTQFGGVPVGGSRYNGMWGGKVLFVDYDNGGSGTVGYKPSDAGKYLDDAISAAVANDTIYVRPRSPELGTGGAGPYYGGDPGDITPKVAATNWTIPYTSYGLSIIGTGIGSGFSSASRTCLQGGTTAGSVVLTVNAPYVNIENIGIKPGSSTAGLISQSFINDSAAQAYANTYNNIWFRNVDAQAAYSLNMDSGSYDNVIGCTFSGHAGGIRLVATNDPPKAIQIKGCIFDSLAATVSADIWSTGAVTRILISGCHFNHAACTGGAPNKYISFAATSTGLISNCFTGSADATVATNFTVNGATYSGCWALESFMVAA